MSNYYNNFKETKIRGTLQVSDHPTDNTKLANAIFDRDITVSGNIINTDLTNKLNSCIKTGAFPNPSETSLNSGLSISWNQLGGTGESDIINYQQYGGGTSFAFYNVSVSLIPTLLIRILNNGYVLLNGINGISSTTLNFLDGVSSNIQSQLNTLSNNFSNYVTSSYLISQNYLTSASLSGYALSSSLSDYVTSSSLSTTINNSLSDFTTNILCVKIWRKSFGLMKVTHLFHLHFIIKLIIVELSNC